MYHPFSILCVYPGTWWGDIGGTKTYCRESSRVGELPHAESISEYRQGERCELWLKFPTSGSERRWKLRSDLVWGKVTNKLSGAGLAYHFHPLYELVANRHVRISTFLLSLLARTLSAKYNVTVMIPCFARNLCVNQLMWFSVSIPWELKQVMTVTCSTVELGHSSSRAVLVCRVRTAHFRIGHPMRV